MTVADDKTRVMITITKDEKKAIERDIKRLKKQGYKVNTSSYLASVISSHIDTLNLFSGNGNE